MLARPGNVRRALEPSLNGTSRASKKPRHAPKMIMLAIYSCFADDWELGILKILDTHNLYDLAEKLCTGVLEKLRPEDIGGSGVDEHVWHFYKEHKKKSKSKWIPFGDPPGHFRVLDRERHVKLVGLNLTEQDVLKFDYDVGSMSTLKLKVLGVNKLQNCEARDLPCFFQPSKTNFSELSLKLLSPTRSDHFSAMLGGHNVMLRFIFDEDKEAILGAVPAWRAGKKMRIDKLFPSFAQMVFGDGHLGFTLGLSSMISRKDDGIFMSLRKEMNDVLFAPMPFRVLDELFALADQPEPSAHGGRMLFPATMDADAESSVQKATEAADKDPFGAPDVFCRMTPQQWSAKSEELKRKGFEFRILFPHTHEQLTSGKFRWISYQGGVLRVCVGRATTARQCPVTNICREWRCTFSSFHELMCAIEASWVVPGTRNQALGDTALEVDLDQGPSAPNNAQPPAARQLASANAFQVLKSSTTQALESRASVSAALFAGHRGQWLFVGFENGRITQWEFQVGGLSSPGPPSTSQTPRKVRTWQAHLRQVGGMAASPCGGKLFTFSSSSIVRVWDARTAECLLVHRVEASGEAYAVNCLVVSHLNMDTGRCVACTVGLDMDDCEDDEPNVLSFDAETGDHLYGWGGHALPVRGLAVVPDRFLVSIAQVRGGGGSELILWNLEEGEMLLQIQPWLHTDLCGLALHGTTLVCMMDFGSTLSVFELDDAAIDHKQIVTTRHFRGDCDDDGFIACSIACHEGRVAAVNEHNEAVTVLDVTALQQCAPEEPGTPSQDEESEDEEESEDGIHSESDWEDDCDKHLLKLMRRQGMDNVLPMSRAMVEGLAEFSCRPLKKAAGCWTRSGGPEVVALRGASLVAGFADGSVHLHSLTQRGSPRRAAADSNPPAPCSFTSFTADSSDDSEMSEDDAFYGCLVDDDDTQEAAPEEYIQDTDKYNFSDRLLL